MTRPAYLHLTRNAGSATGGSLARTSGLHTSNATTRTISSKALNDLLDAVSALTSLSDKDRDSIDTQAKVMMRQIQGAIEELETLEQDRRKRQQKINQAAGGGWNQLMNAGSSSGAVDDMAQHRQGVTLYLNERLASLATLHKDQYETRIAREIEKRESSLYKALPKPGANGSILTQRRPNSSRLGDGGEDDLLGVGMNNTNRASSPRPTSSGSKRSDALATGVSSAQYYHEHQRQPEQDFESSLTAEEQQVLQQENEDLVRRLETELNQVRQLESSMLELSTLHSTIQEHLEVQTLQTNRLHEEALTAIGHIDAGNEYLIKAGKHNSSTRKWILFFLMVAR
ncbi:hypothetical protein BGX31_000064 [Mortierella sp. GBA43]|nr:hypothetical protein BGX31_000064 [Mortierella sp. GBA43]